MDSGTLTKQCDCCRLYLSSSDFYKNKSKVDGFQNRCKDCIKDYKIKLSQGLIETQPVVTREFYFIPNIYLVGVGRTQTYQHCCLNCDDAFFCLEKTKDYKDLFCDGCQANESKIPEKNISKINFIGHVVGWKVKVEDPRKIRIRRNYKKAYQRDCYTCQYCGYNMQNAKEFRPLHIDHIKPWSAKGGNSLDNLKVSCADCNLCASDKWFNSFEEKKEYINFEMQKRVWIHKRKNDSFQEFMQAKGK